MNRVFTINFVVILLTSVLTTAEEANPKLVSNWQRAVAHLDGLGFPGSSGLPYHVIEVDSSEIYEYKRHRLSTGKPKRLTTCGWLLPEVSDKPNQRRRAIACNGHLYPVQQLGPEAYLDEDVAAMREQRLYSAVPVPEIDSLDPSFSSPIAVALLLFTLCLTMIVTIPPVLAKARMCLTWTPIEDG